MQKISNSAIIAKNVTLADFIYIGENVTIQSNSKIDNYSYINPNSIIYSNTKIGKFCSIGRNVEIGLPQHPTNFLSTHPFQASVDLFKEDRDYFDIKRVDWEFNGSVEIGNDVWIGAKASIKSDIKIGDGVIIGAGAVVTKDIEPYSIVVGIPAKVIKMRFNQEIIDQLLDLQWWNLSLKQLSNISFNNIEKAIKELSKV